MKKIYLNDSQVALVDDTDYDFLNQWKWSFYIGGRDKIGYAARKDGDIKISMHKVIAERMGLSDSETIDHRDGNSLNNQRDNLRPATRLQQSYNKKGNYILDSSD